MCDTMDGERKLIIQPIEREMHRSYIDYLAHQGDEYLNFVSGEHAAYDKTMVDTLANVIRRGGPKLLVVMHTHGSHFNYRERYPSSGAYYRPDNLEVVAVREREKLINAYDNSIRYTDEFLAQVIDTVAFWKRFVPILGEGQRHGLAPCAG